MLFEDSYGNFKQYCPINRVYYFANLFNGCKQRAKFVVFCGFAKVNNKLTQ
jgi:hypothetical protein